jgi:hypothetical protein
MGYMGLGMNKELYTRKPKKAFKKLKNIWGRKTNPDRGNVHEQLSEERKLEIAQELRLDRNRTRRNALLFLVALFTAIGFGIDAAVDHIAARKAKHQIHYLVDTWEQNLAYDVGASNLPSYQKRRYHLFMDAGDSLMKAELYTAAAQKYYNANLVYYEDSTAMFGQLKAMIASCGAELRFCRNAMSLITQLQRRYPDSPLLLEWGNRLKKAVAANKKQSPQTQTNIASS